jgi:multiple sugar transport system substrate-binding protein
MYRKISTLIKVSFIFFFLLTFLNTSFAATQIEFWGGWTGPDGDVMRAMVEKFNSTHPDIHVTLTTLQWTPLYSKFMTAFKAGNMPALFATHVQELAYLVDAGVLDPVTDYIHQLGFKSDDFAKRLWDATFYNGIQYGFPLDMHMHGLYYNITMFKNAGLNPLRPPVTWNDLISIATKLTIDANGKHPNEAGFDINHVKQWGLGVPTNHHAFYLWYALMCQQGAGFLTSDFSKVSIDEKKGVAAWKALEDLIYKYHVTPQGEQNPTNDFLNSQVAMVIDGPWQIPAMQRKEGLKWGVGVFPKFGTTQAVWGSGHILVLPKGVSSEARKAAVELAGWIINNSAEWANSGNIPALLSVSKTLKFRTLPGRSSFVSMLPYTVFLPNIPKSLQVYSAVAPGPIILAAQAAMLKNEDPVRIIQDFTQQVNSILMTP